MKKTVKVSTKDIGQRIRIERRNLALSREELAEITGLSDYYVGQLERGERRMSLPALVQVANCLHVSLDYLVFGITINNIYDSGKDIELNNLLNKCSPNELSLIKKLIKTVLPYLEKK